MINAQVIPAPPHTWLYPKERPLFYLSLLIGLSAWGGILVATTGMVLVYVFMAFLAYLFAQSAFITTLHGSAVRLGPEQCADLHRRVQQGAEKIGMAPPEAFLLHGNGVFNALATRFLRRNYIVLFSDVVDAMEERPDAVDFYIGHELGHLHRRHLLWIWLLLPASFLPLLGAAYHRAREYTCDQYGLQICGNRETALKGLVALAAGSKRWNSLDLHVFARQVSEVRGFWGSLHDLLGDYPPLAKRANRLLSPEEQHNVPNRNIIAWLLAALLPRVGGGGSMAGLAALIAVVSIIAAVAIPAYQEFTARSHVVETVALLQAAKIPVTDYYTTHGRWPRMDAKGESMDVVVQTSGRYTGVVMGEGEDSYYILRAFLKSDDEISQIAGRAVTLHTMDGGEHWICGDPDAGTDIMDKYLPTSCRQQP